MRRKELRGKPKANQAKDFRAKPQTPQKWIEKKNDKKKKNDKGRTNDVSGVHKWRENTRGKNLYRRSQHTKMGKHKKRSNEQIALAHAFQRMDV